MELAAAPALLAPGSIFWAMTGLIRDKVRPLHGPCDELRRLDSGCFQVVVGQLTEEGPPLGVNLIATQ